MSTVVTGYELHIEDGVLLGAQALPAGEPVPDTPDALPPDLPTQDADGCDLIWLPTPGPCSPAEEAVIQQRVDAGDRLDLLENALLGSDWAKGRIAALASAAPAAEPVQPLCLTVPEGVYRIADKALMGCIGITEITLPAGLEEIGARAFAGCRDLHTVHFAPGCAPYRLGEGAFAGTGLRSIALPDGPEALPDALFSGCALLERVTLPESVESLGKRAFLGCTALREVRLPATLRTVRQNAFLGCTALRTLALPDGLTEVEDGFFFTTDCGLERLALPAGLRRIDPDNFRGGGCGPEAVTVAPANPRFRVEDGFLYETWLGQKTLLWCPRGRSGAVTVPEGTEVIDRGAFARCERLTEATLPGSVVKIEADAFRSSGLTRIELPAGLKWLGARAFRGCAGLRTVALPDGLRRLQQEVFAGCTALEEITLPAGVERFAPDTFRGCTGLRRVVLTGDGNAAAVLQGLKQEWDAHRLPAVAVCAKAGSSAEQTARALGFAFEPLAE